jgi:hypothetical protein
VVQRFLSHLVSTVDGLAGGGQLSEAELAAWTEPLVVLSNALKNFEQQVAFLRMVLAGALADWTGPVVAAALESPLRFAQAVGVLGASFLFLSCAQCTHRH